MNNRVASEVQTPAIVLANDIAFVIPSYQRPYVWPDDDVLKLFDDINNAREAGEPHYYIGTILTAELSGSESDGGRVLELIDGQQRATTLILLALALRGLDANSALARLATRGPWPRLTFSIRDQVQGLLGAWAGLDGYKKPDDEAISNDPYLIRLDGALKVLRQRFGKMDENERLGLTEYIHEKVQWVNNTVHRSMDLNRLFATTNTSGIQLEKADLLKAALLKKIHSDKKAMYEGIWQACEQMDNYFERNVRKVFSGSNWNAIKDEQLSEFDANLFLLPELEATSSRQARMSLASLAAEKPDMVDMETVGRESSDRGPQEDDNIYCRSIIGFPLLLMHAYRIFRHDYKSDEPEDDINVRLHSDRLIECFHDMKKGSEDEVKAFIECLWQVRYQFDRWVIKWQKESDSDEELLGLTSVSRSHSKGYWYIGRKQKSNSELVQLQSVRYFTGERSAQYWLTPFLGWLVWEDYANENDNEALKLLEWIDNQLSLASNTQKEASYELLNEIDDLNGLKPFREIAQYLSGSLGTHFEHYWFQKLEYVLWKKGDKRDNKLRAYRIVSRNSVEHVYPQHEEHGRNLETRHLDAFGNLALLNPGQNSSYSNQTVEKKQADFKSKPAYDALKLKHIFQLMGQGEWTATRIKQHQEEMISLLSEHYHGY